MVYAKYFSVFCSWLRHYATSRKVAGSSPDYVIGFQPTMALGSTQPLTEMSTRNILGGKGRPAPKADNLAAIYEPIDPMGLHGRLQGYLYFKYILWYFPLSGIICYTRWFRTRPRPLPSNSFQIHLLPTNLTLCGLDTESVVKNTSMIYGNVANSIFIWLTLCITNVHKTAWSFCLSSQRT
jgi:hypothetical protein